MPEIRTRVGGLLVAALLAVAAPWRPIVRAAHDEASAQQNRSRKFGPGECGPVDPAYIHLANETGGQPFFLNPSEIGKAFHYVRESSGADQETLLWTMGTLDSGSAHEFAVPIDSTTHRVTFSLSVDTSGSDLTVIDPTGTAVAIADHRIEITVLNCGRIVTVDGPAAGMWRLHINGVGRFWLTAHARSELSFTSAEFVRQGGRPGHEGLFRITGQPLADAPATLRAHVHRERAASASLDIVSQHGDSLARLKPDSEYDDSAAGEFVATFELPAQPFRVRVSGVDDVGNRFQRVFHTLFHAETVEVAGAAPIDDLVPGTSTAIAFTVKNVGPAASFRIVAADGRRLISRFEPRTLPLESGATGRVTVWLTAPEDAAPGIGSDVTVTATSESGPSTTNGASVHVSISSIR